MKDWWNKLIELNKRIDWRKKLEGLRNRLIDLLNKLNALKLDNKKIFLITLACLSVLYIDLSFIMKLQLEGIRKVTPKIVKIKKDIVSLAKDLSYLQELERKADKDKTKTGAFEPKEIASEDKILLLLQRITAIADQNKVKVTQISTSRDKKVQEEVIAGERLLPVTITLNLSCSYHPLGAFMNALENERYFIELVDMKITHDLKSYLLHNVNLVLKTYVRK